VRWPTGLGQEGAHAAVVLRERHGLQRRVRRRTAEGDGQLLQALVEEGFTFSSAEHL